MLIRGLVDNGAIVGEDDDVCGNEEGEGEITRFKRCGENGEDSAVP